MRERQGLGGIYVATGNSIAVCRYMVENDIKDIKVIGTDIFDDISEYVRRNVMQGVIFQDIVKQGITAVRVLNNHLVRNIPVADEILVAPQLGSQE